MDNGLIISVIVPVYNGEKFIRRAVESVLCQLDGRVELILVDDGSTDSSGAICDEYGMDNPFVRVVHKANGGLSSARNAGMAVAAGEYIVFLDADDYLDSNTCAELAKVIYDHRPDYIDYGYKYISARKEITENLHKLPKNILLGEDVIRNTVLPPLLNLRKDDDCFIYPFAWNKVYRREIIESNAISFDEGRRTWEDRLFVAYYLKYCRNFYSMDQCFYNYVDVAGSLSRQYSMEYFDIILANYRYYTQLYGTEYDFATQYANDYWAHAIENMIFRSLEQKENREQIRQNILQVLQDEQVIHWFTCRMPKDAFEKEMSALVAAGEVQKALRGYEKKTVIEKKRTRIGAVGNNLKRLIRKVIGR